MGDHEMMLDEAAHELANQLAKHFISELYGPTALVMLGYCAPIRLWPLQTYIRLLQATEVLASTITTPVGCYVAAVAE